MAPRKAARRGAATVTAPQAARTPTPELDPIADSIAIQMANNDADAAAIRAAMTAKQKNRPKNTVQTYKGRRKLWANWCRDRQYQDGVLVSEGKLLRFMDEVILPRRVFPKKKGKKGGKKKTLKRKTAWREDRPEAEDGDNGDVSTGDDSEAHVRNPEGVPLKWNTLENYIASIMDIYNEQVSLELNKNPSPRSAAVNAWLEDKKRSTDRQRREAYEDRGLKTLLDGYTMEELSTMCEDLLKQPSKCFMYLRTRLDILIGHYYLTRGETRRFAELADLYPITFDEGQSPTPCQAAVLTMRNGKTNKNGRVEHMGAIRHKNVLTCPVGALAQYLFFRWHLTDEEFPSFRNHQAWYDLKLLVAQDPLHPMEYHTQLEQVTQLFERCGIASSKKTHAMRVSAPNHEHLGGTTVEDIRRAGRWDASVMAKAYLTSLPYGYIRGAAGFRTRGDYHLKRAQVVPPEALLRMVWPKVDEWLERFRLHTTQKASYRNGGVDESDLAAQGFLQLLKSLRPTFLQDSAILQAKFPAHPLLSAEVFQHPEWQGFAEAVLAAEQTQEDPLDVQIQRAMPLLADRFTTTAQAVMANQNVGFSLLRRQVGKVLNHQRDFMEGRIGLYARPAHQPPRAPPAPSASEVPEIEPELTPAPLPLPSDPLTPIMEINRAPRPRPAAASTSSQASFTHQMSPNVKTVKDLWREWKVGVGGGPAIEYLEQAYGSSWRPTNKARTWFCRRKTIIDEIIAKAPFKPGGADDVAEELDTFRISSGSKSLNWLIDYLTNMKRHAGQA